MSGAQHLAMMGFDVVLIQLMARWASEVTLRYIAEAPLGAITDTYRKLAAGRSLASQLDSINVELNDLRLQLAAMSAATTVELTSERVLASSIAQFREDSDTSQFLSNDASGKFHLPFMDKYCVLLDQKKGRF